MLIADQLIQVTTQEIVLDHHLVLILEEQPIETHLLVMLRLIEAALQVQTDLHREVVQDLIVAAVLQEVADHLLTHLPDRRDLQVADLEVVLEEAILEEVEVRVVVRLVEAEALVAAHQEAEVHLVVAEEVDN